MVSSSYCVGMVVFMILGVCKCQQANPEIMSYHVLESKDISLLDYQKKIIEKWTPDKMRAAKPRQLLSLSKFNETNGDNTFKQLLDDVGSPFFVPGIRPDNITIENRALAVSQIVKTAGKVFYVLTDGIYECSGCVVAAPSGSLLVTAAHCVFDYDTQSWSSDWVFVPSYINGNAPFGFWAAKSITMLKAFSTSSESAHFLYDVAFVSLFPNENNQKISQITGAQGIAFNTGYGQPVRSFGYPSNIADGEIRSSCSAKETKTPCNYPGYTGYALRCNMGGGCSGGPWVRNFNKKTGRGFIMSVNSFACSSKPGFIHGPRFTNTIRSLYNGVKNQA